MSLIGSQYGHGGAAQRIDAQLETGAANGVHVDDVPQGR